MSTAHCALRRISPPRDRGALISPSCLCTIPHVAVTFPLQVTFQRAPPSETTDITHVALRITLYDTDF